MKVLILASFGSLLALLCYAAAIVRRNRNRTHHYALVTLAYGELLPLISALTTRVSGQVGNAGLAALAGVAGFGIAIALASILHLRSVGYQRVPAGLGVWGFSLAVSATAAVRPQQLPPAIWALLIGGIGLGGVVIMSIGIVGASRQFVLRIHDDRQS